MILVLDASVVVELLLGRPAASAIEALIFSGDHTLHAPHLIDVEVAHAFRRLWFSGDLSELRGEQALTDLATMPLQRLPHGDLIARVWELRRNLSAYDAIYVALAEVLDAPLITCDAKLAAAPGHSADIRLLTPPAPHP